jgi:uncharacterized membrane protein
VPVARATASEVGQTRRMTAVPSPTLYHRSLGWHAPALRRAVIVAVIGLVTALVLVQFLPWALALVGGWDAAALTFLGTVWPIIVRADGVHTERLATREDATGGNAAVLVVGASVASLLGVGFTLGLAGRVNGSLRVLLIALAMVTVMLSWTVINTVFTLRYAHLHFDAGAQGLAFGDVDGQHRPDYRDFAYVAFTIGMTYQVSDTTIRDRRTRRTVLSHALLSYLFGVVIVAGAINLVAGLIR